ncbi:TRAP transporter large permease (plasmid) [Tistrella mobilis]|uniref:TRAP transporter large permease n=1 Tax=Tistrella mobilis TaxID=171437 RepID=UPI003555C1F9
MIVTIAFLILFALLLLRTPIAAATGLVGIGGLAVYQGIGPALSQIGIIATETVLTYEFAVIPLFILMGAFISRSGIAEELYRACHALVGHRRGGLAVATVIACGGFGAVCGSSLATAATMSRVAYPPMKKYGYSDALASGSIAAGGTLGILIPPSIALVFYGILTETDIGQLFIAGLLPGVVGILLYAAAVVAVTTLDRKAGPAAERMPLRDRLKALRDVWATGLLFVIVMGGIYGGFFSPTESAGIGAVGALLITAARGRASLAMVRDALTDAAHTTVALIAILIGAFLFANLINVASVPQALVAWIGAMDVPPLVVILAIIGVYLVLGCVLESMSMMLLTVPVFYPLVASLGYDLIWFGIVVVVVTEISLITPPIGLNVFVLRAVLPDVRLASVFRGVMPFIAADVVRLALILFVPWLSLALPQLMR